MKSTLNIIFLTIALYALDVIVWGSFLGLVYVLGHYTSNILFGTDYSLTVSYFKGLVTYWILDSILAKFREIYKMIIEDKRDEK